MKKKLMLFALLSCLSVSKAMATIVYVDSSNVAGTQDGSSWSTAFYTLQDGIDFSDAGDTIWVAKGTYLLAPSTSFTMKEGVKVFGGFLNTHTNYNQRNWQTNVTRLSGNNASIIRNNNNGLTATAVLDGFTLTGGVSSNIGGGAIYNNNVSPTIRNCSFISNSASAGATMLGGGAMYNYNSSPVIDSCIFSKNIAMFASGSGLYTGSGGAIYNDQSSPVITNCSFTNQHGYSSNQFTIRGGAIYNSHSSGNIHNCTFTNDTALMGGAVYNYMSTCSITGSIFSLNKSTNLPGFGGAIYNDKSVVNFRHCLFTGNRTNGQIGTTSPGRGGAMYNLASSVVIDSCNFISNTAGGSNSGTRTYGGGAIYNDSAFLFTAKHCLFSQNTAGGFNFGGGAIANYKGININIDSCTFFKNSAFASTLGGGGIYNFYNSANITNCKFSENISSNGGAIQNKYSYPNIANDSFYANVAREHGGGISNDGDTLNTFAINNCVFIKDSATSSILSSEYGGGIYNYQVAVNVTNCLFSEGYSGDAGAGMYNALSKVNIYNCIFSSNKGTGVYCGGSKYIIESCQFINNEALVEGGAIKSLGNSNPVNLSIINNTIFTGNRTTSMSNSLGGAIYLNDSTLIKNCTFSNNSSCHGGAMAILGNSSRIVNCIFSKNAATYLGGGMYILNASPFVINGTFSGNRVDSLTSPFSDPTTGGGAVYNTGTNPGNDSSANFVNCIMWGNSTGVLNNSDAFPTFSYGLIQGMGAFPARRLLAGTTNPMFVDTASGDYHLQLNSPCINKGNNLIIPAGITTDRDGNPRIINDTVDLGAFEFQGIPLPLHLLSFTGNKTDNSIKLRWNTANEQQTTGFELQRSTNHQEFQTIIYIPAKQKDNNDYSYIDEQPQSTNYYRLLMKDSDGHSTYSDILYFSFEQPTNGTSIYPNPAKEVLTIKISNKSALNSQATIIDIYGKTMKSLILDQHVQEIFITDLEPGVYLLKLANGQIFKFVKE